MPSCRMRDAYDLLLPKPISQSERPDYFTSASKPQAGKPSALKSVAHAFGHAIAYLTRLGSSPGGDSIISAPRVPGQMRKKIVL